MSEFTLPPIDELSRPYWDGLEAGKLRFQQCGGCGNRWLPAREACPACLAPGPRWVDAAGTGRVLSWVVYHVAYHDAFKERLPYDVTLVELDEGPRLLTNIVNSGHGRSLRPDARVTLQPEREADRWLARFRLL